MTFEESDTSKTAAETALFHFQQGKWGLIWFH